MSKKRSLNEMTEAEHADYTTLLEMRPNFGYESGWREREQWELQYAKKRLDWLEKRGFTIEPEPAADISGPYLKLTAYVDSIVAHLKIGAPIKNPNIVKALSILENLKKAIEEHELRTHKKMLQLSGDAGTWAGRVSDSFYKLGKANELALAISDGLLILKIGADMLKDDPTAEAQVKKIQSLLEEYQKTKE